MLHLVAWTIVVGLAVLWSLACWALGSFGAWALSNADQLSGMASGVGQWPIPAWLHPWLPEGFEGLRPLLAEFASWIARFLKAIPGLSEGFTVVVWLIWAMGGGLLVVMGAAGSAATVWWGRRRRQESKSGPV